MKHVVIILTVILTVLPSLSLGQAVNTKLLTEPTLSEGQCHTLVDSKVYLSDLTGKSPNKKAIEEIGATAISQLANSKAESYYFCKIKCNLQSQFQFFWITQKDRNDNFKNVNGFVCSGVGIRDVAISSTLSIKTTVAVPFVAAQSDFADVHTKLKEISYKITGEQLGKLLNEFFETLRIIQNGYSLARSDMFQSAATELQTYMPSQPGSWALIKAKVKYLEEQNPNPSPSIGSLKTGDDLVNMIFLKNGLFLRYVN